MSAGYYWDEALPMIVGEIDWSGITSDQWAAIGGALDDHVSTAQEFLPPVPSSRDIQAMNDSPVIAALKAEVDRLQSEVDTYRSSVATRRGVPLHDVQLENGSVVYGRSFR